MKDPAFLFYSSDFLTGTIFMDYEQKGMFITLLCIQHQKGRLTERQIKTVCGDSFDFIIEKFKKDEDGLYYNERLEYEAEKRAKYSESRRKNRKTADYENTCVYLMKDHMNGHVKVGHSNKPLRRLLELREQNGREDIDLLCFVKNSSQRIEAEIHKKYKDKCVYNEWFALSDDDIKSIISEYNMKNQMNTHISNHMIVHMENENEIENVIETENKIEKKKGSVRGKNKPESLLEVEAFFQAEGSDQAEAFFDYFESVDWVIGKSKKPCRNWRAAARNWMRSQGKYQPQKENLTTGLKSRPEMIFDTAMRAAENLKQQLKENGYTSLGAGAISQKSDAKSES
jgi:hypothetical protein